MPCPGLSATNSEEMDTSFLLLFFFHFSIITSYGIIIYQGAGYSKGIVNPIRVFLPQHQADMVDFTICMFKSA